MKPPRKTHGWRPYNQKALTRDELRYAMDAAEVRPELHTLGNALKKIDGSAMYGIPLREMTKTELMACCVRLGEMSNTLLYRTDAQV